MDKLSGAFKDVFKPLTQKDTRNLAFRKLGSDFLSLEPIAGVSGLFLDPLKKLKNELTEEDKKIISGESKKSGIIRRLEIILRIYIIELVRSNAVFIDELIVPFFEVLKDAVVGAAVTTTISTILGSIIPGLGNVVGFAAGFATSIVGGLPLTVITLVVKLVPAFIRVLKDIFRKDNPLRGDITNLLLATALGPIIISSGGAAIPALIPIIGGALFFSLVTNFVRLIIKSKRKLPKTDEGKKEYFTSMVAGVSPTELDPTRINSNINDRYKNSHTVQNFPEKNTDNDSDILCSISTYNNSNYEEIKNLINSKLDNQNLEGFVTRNIKNNKIHTFYLFKDDNDKIDYVHRNNEGELNFGTIKKQNNYDIAYKLINKYKNDGYFKNFNNINNIKNEISLDIISRYNLAVEKPEVIRLAYDITKLI